MRPTLPCPSSIEAVQVVRMRDEDGFGDFVRILGEDGTYGVFGPIDPASAMFTLGVLATALVSQRPADGDKLRSCMRAAHRHSGTGLAVVATSAVDCALWDLRGKLVGCPVRDLLGHQTREHIPVYASLFGCDASALADCARHALKLGFAGVKLSLRPPDDIDDASLTANVTIVQTVREAIGPSACLMADAFGQWTPEYTRDWCARVREFNVAWLEEPLAPGDLRGIAELSRVVPVPIAAGEHAYTFCEAEALLSLGGIAVLQSDISWCGLTEGLRIAATCAAAGVPLCPHGAGLLPALHLAATYSYSVMPMLEYHLKLEPRRQRWFTNQLTPCDGHLTAPVQPGLGLELRPDLLRRAEVATTPEELCHM
jgi:L-rhamnonate dehydratase